MFIKNPIDNNTMTHRKLFEQNIGPLKPEGHKQLSFPLVINI